MKTKLHSTLTALATALAFGMNLHAAVQVPANSALAHSPRYLEEHPELLRRGMSDVAPPGSWALTRTSNRALAASPRYLEQHPELGRVAVARDRNDQSVPREVLRNRAFAASPRVLEEYPALARGLSRADQTDLQIAPVK
jgi:hypothetical protein